MPDPIFADARLAEIYDYLDSDRSDLHVYAALILELGARSVLDVGCGTGTFACMLAALGLEVVGVDPSDASLTVAKSKPSADRVRWILGDATTLQDVAVDVATMTGNVAQVFLADHDFLAALRGIREALRLGGWLVFEARDPSVEAWRTWNHEETHAWTDIPGVGRVESWIDLVDISGQLVSFRGTYNFADVGDVLTSDSTLRFREQKEIETLLTEAGFRTIDVREAPDRPGKEFVFVAQVDSERA